MGKNLSVSRMIVKNYFDLDIKKLDFKILSDHCSN